MIIPSDSDLNTLEYIQPGMYRTLTRSITQTLINCPAKNVFIMHVERLTSEDTDWMYIHREIVDATSDAIYHQYANYRSSTGTINFYSWFKVTMTEATT